MSHVSYAEPPAQGWDIHCHTVFSDGTETPRTLVEQARKLGLHGAAIADHDTTAGWGEATEASEEIGLPLLLGTEITAVDEDVSVHMLAFQYDPSNEHISSMFANTRAARLRRTKRMVERLSQDFPITWDDVLAQVKEGERTTIGRPHIADALVAAGVTALECVGGRVSVIRGLTTRTKTGNAADKTFRELTTILIVDDVIPSIRRALRAKFTRAKNSALTRNAIRNQVIVELEDRIDKEIIEGYDNLTVTASTTDPTTCVVEFEFRVVHGLNRIYLTAHISV